jgi:hypothetical protein
VRRTVSPRKFACQTFSLSEDMSHTPPFCPDECEIYVTGGQPPRSFNMRYEPEKMARRDALHDTGTPIARVAIVAWSLSLTWNRCFCAVSARGHDAEVRLARCRRKAFERWSVRPNVVPKRGDSSPRALSQCGQLRIAFPRATCASKNVAARKECVARDSRLEKVTAACRSKKIVCCSYRYREVATRRA